MASIYTTQAQILGEIQLMDLIALTDDTNTGNVDTTVLNQIIANAGGFIDSKIANIYGEQLPFTGTIPSSVASMALTITCYRLYRRRLVPDEKNNFTEEYNNVVAFLNEVNEGIKHLNDVPSRDYPQGAVTGQTVVYGGQIFFNGRLANTM